MRRGAWLVLLLAACSRRPLEIPEERTGPRTWAELRQRLHRLECEGMFRCCADLPYTGVDECVSVVDGWHAKNPNRMIEAALASGALIFDGEAAVRCLLDARDLADACNSLTPIEPRSCTAALRGTLAIGAACERGVDECAPGERCVRESDYAPLRCVAAAPLGAGCVAPVCTGCAQDPCADGLACVAASCVPLGQIGDACDLDEHCLSGTCRIDSPSPTGESCILRPQAICPFHDNDTEPPTGSGAGAA